MSEAESAVLLRVRELAPQVNDIGLVMAQCQIERNDIDAARKLLTVIAGDTHDRAASEAAAALLAKLDTAPAAPLVPAAASGH
jgi:thioredoxin-like negative regulator of GroEL